MNYEKMSDFEIDKLVAKVFLPCDYVINEDENVIELVGTSTYLGAFGNPDERIEKYGEFSPCTISNHAWPIIVENKIDIQHRVGVKTGCVASLSGDSEIYHISENPLRAAMIVFLMMNGVGEI